MTYAAIHVGGRHCSVNYLTGKMSFKIANAKKKPGFALMLTHALEV